MSMKSLWQRLRHRARFERELDDELAFHLEARREHLIRNGHDEAEATRRLKMARARVQLELIENIMHNIEMMRRDTDLELSDIVTLRVLETLEQTAQLQDVNMMIPNRVMSTMSQIKQILAHYEGDEDEETPERLPAIPPSRSMMGRQP